MSGATRHAPSQEARSARRRCSTRRAPPAGRRSVRRKPMQPSRPQHAARVGGITYGVKPTRGPGHPDERTDAYHSAPNSYGMLAFRQRLHHRAGAALRSRGHAAADRAPSSITHYAHGADHVRALAAACLTRSRRRYDLSSLRLHRARRCPCPVAGEAAPMIKWWGPVINEYLGATETGIPIWHSSAEALAKPGTVGRAIEAASSRSSVPMASPARRQ